MSEVKELTIENIVKGLDNAIEINDMKINAHKQGLEILEGSAGVYFTNDVAELTRGFIEDLEFNQQWLKAIRRLLS